MNEKIKGALFHNLGFRGNGDQNEGIIEKLEDGVEQEGEWSGTCMLLLAESGMGSPKIVSPHE